MKWTIEVHARDYWEHAVIDLYDIAQKVSSQLTRWDNGGILDLTGVEIQQLARAIQQMGEAMFAEREMAATAERFKRHARGTPVERRRFLMLLGASAAGLLVPELWLPKRKTYFLPMGKAVEPETIRMFFCGVSKTDGYMPVVGEIGPALLESWPWGSDDEVRQAIAMPVDLGNGFYAMDVPADMYRAGGLTLENKKILPVAWYISHWKPNTPESRGHFYV